MQEHANDLSLKLKLFSGHIGVDSILTYEDIHLPRNITPEEALQLLRNTLHPALTQCASFIDKKYHYTCNMTGVPEGTIYFLQNCPQINFKSNGWELWLDKINLVHKGVTLNTSMHQTLIAAIHFAALFRQIEVQKRDFELLTQLTEEEPLLDWLEPSSSINVFKMLDSIQQALTFYCQDGTKSRENLKKILTINENTFNEMYPPLNIEDYLECIKRQLKDSFLGHLEKTNKEHAP